MKIICPQCNKRNRNQLKKASFVKKIGGEKECHQIICDTCKYVIDEFEVWETNGKFEIREKEEK